MRAPAALDMDMAATCCCEDEELRREPAGPPRPLRSELELLFLRRSELRGDFAEENARGVFAPLGDFGIGEPSGVTWRASSRLWAFWRRMKFAKLSFVNARNSLMDSCRLSTLLDERSKSGIPPPPDAVSADENGREDTESPPALVLELGGNMNPFAVAEAIGLGFTLAFRDLDGLC